MIRSTAATLSGALVALFTITALAATPGELPTVTLMVGSQKVVAEVAASPERRSYGLMHRFSLKPDHGMLFVFERSEPQAFWMKNTFIPLSIAFIAADGRIVNIEDMAPQTEESHWSKGPALYALEMRKGWFRDKGIGPGTVVKGMPPVGR